MAQTFSKPWNTKVRLRRWLSSLVLLGTLAAILISRTSSGVIDLDLFHEMALAREIIDTGRVPWTDSFAYTPTVDVVVHHEWGFGLLALILGRSLGGSGIIALKFALMLGLGWVIWCTARRRGSNPVVSALFLFLALLLAESGFTTVRAQMVSYLMTALLLASFDRDRRGDRWWLVGIALLFPLWVNMHGGCLVGAALLACHWLEQLLRRQPHWHLFWMGLALIPLAALNPWGFYYHAYLVHALTLPRPSIVEWSPLWHTEHSLHLQNFLISLFPLALILMKKGGWNLPGLLIVLATGLAAVKSVRFLPFYAIAFASYLPGAFSSTVFGIQIRLMWYRYQGLLSCLLVATGLVFFERRAVTLKPWQLLVPGHIHPAHGDHLLYPVAAVDYLQKNQFAGHVMVPYPWGSYVMWRLGPGVQVSIDSRYEVAYPPGSLEEDIQFCQAEGDWPGCLSRYSTDLVLVRSNLPVAHALRQYPGWRLVYSDPEFLIFAREGIHLPPGESNSPPRDGRFP